MFRIAVIAAALLISVSAMAQQTASPEKLLEVINSLQQQRNAAEDNAANWQTEARMAQKEVARLREQVQKLTEQKKLGPESSEQK